MFGGDEQVGSGLGRTEHEKHPLSCVQHMGEGWGCPQHERQDSKAVRGL